MQYLFTRFTGQALDELDLEELVSKLAERLLSSGAGSASNASSLELFQFSDQSLQFLHDAILDTLQTGDLLSEETQRTLFGDPTTAGMDENTIESLIQELIKKMSDEGYISTETSNEFQAKIEHIQSGPEYLSNSTFNVTDKGLDFLGYRALRDLLGSKGYGALGKHGTRELATGVEAGGSSKPYEFGDHLNLDSTATILNAVRRTRKLDADGINITYGDLMVSQGELQSSCATVLLLDCSHSMILYGEDRFTPAKRVALALSHLIKNQYPGDTLKAVLFHDSAEEISLKQLARVQVGPYYTNTRAGLCLARRILERQRKDMRQIVMITDGKPSALTTADGQIYRNSFGLDPTIIRETFAEVGQCRHAGIMINTFMLARDIDLLAFVKRVSTICRGKAYFTTPHSLGQYVLMDYMNKKAKVAH